MKQVKKASRVACAILAITLIAGAAVASGNQGSQQNPLVTLSYLNEVVVPEILKQVDEKLNAKAGNLKGGQTAFVPVEVSAGKSITLSTGSQLLVRSGRLTSASAMVDMTDATTWNGEGSGMKANHLYIATGDNQKVTAVTAAKVMVQGSYTLD